MRGGKPFWKKVLPPRAPLFQKLLSVSLRKAKGGYAVHQLRQAFYFCQFVMPCFFALRDKASLAACPDACLGACVGTASACQEFVTGLWPWKIQWSQRRQGTSCSCGTGDSCRDGAPPAWEMAACAGRAGGLPLDGLPEPGRNGDGEQRPRGHCLVPAGRPLASSSCGEDETVSPEQSEPHRVRHLSCVCPTGKAA